LKGNNNKTKVRQFNEFLEKIFSAKKENKESFQLEEENAVLQTEKNLLLDMLSHSFLSYPYRARNKNKTLKKPI
jgi:cell shape-determining protein MreC